MKIKKDALKNLKKPHFCFNLQIKNLVKRQHNPQDQQQFSSHWFQGEVSFSRNMSNQKSYFFTFWQTIMSNFGVKSFNQSWVMTHEYWKSWLKKWQKYDFTSFLKISHLSAQNLKEALDCYIPKDHHFWEPIQDKYVFLVEL